MSVVLLCSRCHYPFKADGFQMMCGDCQVAQREEQLMSENSKLQNVVREQQKGIEAWKHNYHNLQNEVGERDEKIRQLNAKLDGKR